jgi:cardiolipin synthase
LAFSLEATHAMKNWKKEVFTIPNLLSFFRLILIPVYIHIYLKADQPMDYALAATVLAISCITDFVDGKIARKFNMHSTIGQLLDPVADKATQFSLMLCLALEYRILWSLIFLFVIKESFQLIAMLIFYYKGKMLKGALFSGKLCTTVLFLSLIIMVLLHDIIHPDMVQIITYIDGIFMLISLIHYVITYWKKTPMIQDI